MNAARFGWFATDPEIKLVRGTNDLELMESLVWIAPEGRVHVLPAGFRWDGASWMAWLLSLLGQKIDRRFRRPTAFHDDDCVRRVRPAWQAHRDFWRMLRAEGVHPVKAAGCWAAVTCANPWWRVRATNGANGPQ